jgi:uncharacterized membrane protein
MTMRNLRLLLAGTALGATTMYLFDPDRGRRRRHVLQDRARAARNDVQTLAGKAERDLENRVHGMTARLRGSPRSLHAERGVMSEGTPERRLIEGVAGAAAGLWGLSHRGLTGLGALAAGGYLLARSAVRMEHGAVRLQKTITIGAPLEQIFEHWSRPENFPRFMERALIVDRVAGRKLVWRSADESPVVHHGEIHFERLGDGATRLSIHMAYEPPGGALGHAVSGLFRGDPKRLMDEDLVRMKSLFEDITPRAHVRDARTDGLL